MDYSWGCALVRHGLSAPTVLDGSKAMTEAQPVWHNYKPLYAPGVMDALYPVVVNGPCVAGWENETVD